MILPMLIRIGHFNLAPRQTDYRRSSGCAGGGYGEIS